jgi:hypothetical protein
MRSEEKPIREAVNPPLFHDTYLLLKLSESGRIIPAKI